MSSFNKGKYITEGSYSSDLHDSVVMSKDIKSLFVLSSFLGIEWDDEITVMPEPTLKWYRGVKLSNKEYIPGMYMDREVPVFSYLIEGIDSEGQEVLFFRRNTGSSSKPVLYLDGVEFNVNKIVKTAKWEDPDFSKNLDWQ